MSKKRGLSLEEKREQILQIFYESQDFFLVYFWSLPSSAGNQLINTRTKLESELGKCRKRLSELTGQRDNLKKGREESDEREAALEELKAVELQHKKLKEELACYADNDPAALQKMIFLCFFGDITEDATEVAHTAANRWTDNIFTLQQWCSTNFPQAKEQLEHMYKEVGITDDFEYLQ
ncbi:meiotic nuclear division protein 1 homolog isoform X3 [Zingiber officinale]|uniref:meiotic nuclear division protein 1 homolog isoform X3 n=1 Tax=Zingiber officinale TaxID=94328 RepID=UPI001C4CD6C0|nr:meiotic nuclear division protein 1 homolog isoform X3 [Zingiber officinale]